MTVLSSLLWANIGAPHGLHAPKDAPPLTSTELGDITGLLFFASERGSGCSRLGTPFDLAHALTPGPFALRPPPAASFLSSSPPSQYLAQALTVP